jgi:hypothetical protein
MTKQEFIEWVKSKGYEDKRGSGRFIKTRPDGKVICYKVSNVAVRYELQVNHEAIEYSKAYKDWVRVASNYLKYLSINEDGRLAGLKN